MERTPKPTRSTTDNFCDQQQVWRETTLGNKDQFSASRNDRVLGFDEIALTDGDNGGLNNNQPFLKRFGCEEFKPPNPEPRREPFPALGLSGG